MLLLVLPGTFTACRAPVTLGQQEERQRYAQREYPADAEYGPDLDIVVRREGDRLTLINRTARAYRDQTLWLNQQFVRDLPIVEIGPGNRFDLTRWINQHRQPFPVGSLLSPDKAKPVVLAELYDPATKLRSKLLVWPEETVNDD